MRELRNDTSGVLRRVEAGERLIVTGDRRPVAALARLPAGVRGSPPGEVWGRIATSRADAGLAGQLGQILTERVGDL